MVPHRWDRPSDKVKRYEKRSDLKSVSYRLIGWWATDLALLVFWVIPIVMALCIGAFGFLSAHVLRMIKDWWSDEPPGDKEGNLWP